METIKLFLDNIFSNKQELKENIPKVHNDYTYDVIEHIEKKYNNKYKKENKDNKKYFKIMK